MPIVSIIIPCFNHGKYINEAVDSVLNQTFQDFEIIIINDGSTDDFTNQILQNYRKEKTKVIHIENSGVASARNIGIQAASGKYILPLDADDRILPQYLEKAVLAMEQNEKLGIVYCKARFFGAMTHNWELKPYSLDVMLDGNCIFSTALFRRSSWEKVGGYKAQMDKGLEDYEFWLSLIENGAQVLQIPEILFEYRKHNTSRTTVSNKNIVILMVKIISYHLPFYQININFLTFRVKIIMYIAYCKEKKLLPCANTILYIINKAYNIARRLKSLSV